MYLLSMVSALSQNEVADPSSLTPRVVITAGSYTCRAGFSIDSSPRSVIPSAVGAPLKPGILGTNKWHCGKEAISICSNPELEYPIQRGIVTNYEKVEELLKHVFYNELRVKPEEHAVMLSEVPIGPKANRERMIELMFESLNVGALHIKQQMLLSLIASGRMTGLVVHSGSDATRIVPVYQGYSLPHAIIRLDKGGNGVTSRLTQLLSEHGYSLTTPAERGMAQGMKEKLAFVSEDYRRDMSLSGCVREEEFRLPDGRVVRLGSERFKCTEFLFDPPQIGYPFFGIENCAFSSVTKCDVEIRRDLFNNVLLSGGNSMLRGFDKRLERELRESAPVPASVRVLSPPARDFSSWYGGAILSSHSSMSARWVTKDEYNDSGPNIVHRKCS